MSLAPDLMQLLCCPRCRGRLSERSDGLACGACRLVFPIVDGAIPQFLAETARPLEDARG